MRQAAVAAAHRTRKPATVWGIAAPAPRRARRTSSAINRAVRAAQDEVVRTIGRELHDGPVQTLTAMIVQLEELRRLPEPPDGREEVIDLLADSARSMMRDLRSMLCELRAEPGIDPDIAVGLRPLLERFHEMTGVGVAVAVPAQPVALPRPQSVELRRIVGEALTNVARHAQASTVQLTVQVVAQTLVVTVSDDGRGRQPLLAAPGVGISGMRERAALIGARLAIDDVEPHGTRVRVAVPLEDLDGC